ncbi:MAG: 2-oxoacid:acceptor oxidoreductase subunit alpha [Planctomycetota bacterium]|jgi:2-oxoglutarate ferredoxin oxidoreductase subunit alpha
MSSRKLDLAIAIGGAAGQGIATPGNIMARLFTQRGLHVWAYNAYQSIIRGGHIFLTVRVSEQPLTNHGDKLDVLVCLNQDTMNRHLGLMGPGTAVVYNSDLIKPEHDGEGAQLCPMPVRELTDNSLNRNIQNTVALGAIVHLSGLDFATLEESLTNTFQRKGQDVVDENVNAARAGYEHAKANFPALAEDIPTGEKPLALWTGNDAIAMGGAAAGVKFYCAYPMSPSTGVLHWMSKNCRDLGIMVRQIEDEIGVANMTIGAAHTGCRSMCATSGGGFALMTEAIGMASIMEIPCVFVNVMRGGPSTGLPTKTEQADLWQALGASQGDFQRLIVAPLDSLDAFNTMPEIFNLTDHYQVPGIVLSDLLISEGTFSADPDVIDFQPEIDRGDFLLGQPAPEGEFHRYENTESGVSPRAVPGMEGHVHVVASDEHDEDSTLLSDEFTNPHKRLKMADKRDRKMSDMLERIAGPELEGPTDADVTLVCWGSTSGVLREAVEMLNAAGTSTNLLSVKWIVPLHGDAITKVFEGAKKTIMVEQNQTGQFARYLRSETGLKADADIRKYDGEPFMPHHIVEGVQAILEGSTDQYIPTHEIMV